MAFSLDSIKSLFRSAFHVVSVLNHCFLISLFYDSVHLLVMSWLGLKYLLIIKTITVYNWCPNFQISFKVQKMMSTDLRRLSEKWKLILNIEFIFRHQKDFWLTWHARGIYILAHNQRNYYGGRNIKTEIYWKISSLIFSLRIKIIIIFISFSLLVEKNFKENFISSIKRNQRFPLHMDRAMKKSFSINGKTRTKLMCYIPGSKEKSFYL